MGKRGPKAGQFKKHGMHGTKEYRAWQNMKLRCLDPDNHGYKDYGGRGITICDEWKGSFISFFKSVGLAPSKKHQLDRIDNEGNYEPGNCRWATSHQQRINQRKSLAVRYGVPHTDMKELAKKHGLSYWALQSRLKRKGMTLDEALNTPPRYKK